MSRLRYVLAAAVVVAVAAIVAVAFGVRDEQSSSAGTALPKGTLLAASADLLPQSFLFGQPVHVEIDAVVDHRKLDPSRVQLDANWTPYTPIAPMTSGDRRFRPARACRSAGIAVMRFHRSAARSGC